MKEKVCVNGCKESPGEYCPWCGLKLVVPNGLEELESLVGTVKSRAKKMKIFLEYFTTASGGPGVLLGKTDTTIYLKGNKVHSDEMIKSLVTQFQSIITNLNNIDRILDGEIEIREEGEYTREEIRDKFLSHIAELSRYWALDVERQSILSRCDGLAFSILVLLDGCSFDFPAFAIAPLPHPTDKEYLKSEGERWYPENDESKMNGEIGGALHEEYNNYARKRDGDNHGPDHQ